MLAASLAALSSGQVTFESLRNRHLKQENDGAPLLSIFEQIEFMQTAVDTLQNFLGGAFSAKSDHDFNSGSGDYIWQYLHKKNFGDFLMCQTCWLAAGEA